MPPGLIDQQRTVLARAHPCGDLGQVQAHALGVAPRQDQAGRGAGGRADRAEDVGRCRALILWRRWPGAAFGPAPGDLVLLADPGFVGEPDLYAAGAGARRAPDRVQTRGETFLKASMAPAAWAWWRGRAESLRYPI